jgi:xanthine dehydrogenase accessory factor
MHTGTGLGCDAGEGGATAMIKGESARLAERLAADRQPFVLATVVRARHPTSVRAGDAALVLTDGRIEGFVGGVCAASSVRLHALRVLETGEPLLLRLVPGDGAGDEADAVDIADGVVVERNPCLSGGSLEIFLEPQLPAPRMLVLGEAPIARALADLARAAAYEVLRGADAEAPIAEGTAAVVVASHGNDEERVLAAALSAGVPYVGLVASSVRGAAVRAALDVPDELRAQLHTPAGLEIGASDPPEIALAILAQIVAERHASPSPARRTPSPSAGAAAVSAIDPVCGMEVVVAPATPQLEIEGGRLFFCCERCRDAFAEQHAHDAVAR